MPFTTSPILPADLVECAGLHLEAFADDEYTRVIRPMHLRDPSISQPERCEGFAEALLYELSSPRRTTARKAVDVESGQIIGHIFWVESLRPGSAERNATKPPARKAYKSTEIDQEASAAFKDSLDEQLKKLDLDGHTWCLNRLATRPGFEGRGVASQLMQETMQEIATLEENVPLLTVSSHKAEKLYHAHGFQTLARVEIKTASEKQSDSLAQVPSWPLVVKRSFRD